MLKRHGLPALQPLPPFTADRVSSRPHFVWVQAKPPPSVLRAEFLLCEILPGCLPQSPGSAVAQPAGGQSRPH